MANDFNGSDQFLYYTGAIATSAPLAISCWFKSDDNTNWKEIVAISKDTGSGLNNFFRLSCYGSHPTADPIVAETADGSAVSSATSTTSYTAGVWHHAFALFAADNARSVWLDGGGSNTETTSRTPSGLNRTAIGTKIRQTSPGYNNAFDGQLAEVAIWAGSGVENMGAAEAALLAAGFSPRCLRRWAANLVLYQDLIRPLNRPGCGPALTAMNGPGVAAHPRAIYPRGMPIGVWPPADIPDEFIDPYRLQTGAAEGGVSWGGQAAVAGVLLGTTIPFGEVSS